MLAQIIQNGVNREDCIEWQYDENHVAVVSKRELRVIKSNLEKGLTFVTASPLREITREDAAVIMTLDWEALG